MISVLSVTAYQTRNPSAIHMYNHSVTTQPPFLCTAWNEAVADFPPAVQEMPVSVTALQREEGEDRERKTINVAVTRTEVRQKYKVFIVHVKMEHFTQGFYLNQTVD